MGGVGKELHVSDNYLVVMQHPVTTEHGLARTQIEETLQAIKELNLPTYWFWPNVDAGSDGTSKGIRVFREKHPNVPIHFFKDREGRQSHHIRTGWYSPWLAGLLTMKTIFSLRKRA